MMEWVCACEIAAQMSRNSSSRPRRLSKSCLSSSLKKEVSFALRPRPLSLHAALGSAGSSQAVRPERQGANVAAEAFKTNEEKERWTMPAAFASGDHSRFALSARPDLKRPIPVHAAEFQESLRCRDGTFLLCDLC